MTIKPADIQVLHVMDDAKTLWKRQLQLHPLINNLAKKMPNKKILQTWSINRHINYIRIIFLITEKS
jgi:hypothetical protein